MKSAIFDYSRDPLAALLRGEKENAAWFARHGARAVRTLVHDLRASTEVRRVDIHHRDRKFAGVFGEVFFHTIDFSVRFKKGEELALNSAGSGNSPGLAAVRALGELLERVGFRLRTRLVRDEFEKSIAIRSERLILDSSNGACFHSSAVQALKGAFCELLERDAFLANWYSDRPLPVTRITHGHPLCALETKYAKTGWHLREHRWTNRETGAVAIWLSLARANPRPDEWNFFIGGACGQSHREALGKAREELTRSYAGLTGEFAIDTQETLPKAPSPSSPFDRVLIYQRPEFVERFIKKLGRPEAFQPDRSKNKSEADFVRTCLEKFASTEITPLLVPAKIRDHVYGVKVTCRELQSLDWQVPARFNFERIKTVYGTSKNRVNQEWHPIP